MRKQIGKTKVNELNEFHQGVKETIQGSMK